MLIACALGHLDHNPHVDNLVKLPPWLYAFAVVFFGAPVVALLLLQGRHGAAFLIVLSVIYAALLGRSLLWRRLGQPPMPADRRKPRDKGTRSSAD